MNGEERKLWSMGVKMSEETGRLQVTYTTGLKGAANRGVDEITGQKILGWDSHSPSPVQYTLRLLARMGYSAVINVSLLPLYAA